MGGISGDQFFLTLDAITARGYSSSVVLTPNFPGGSVSGPEHTVVMSKVISITNANPDGEGTNIPMGVRTPGQFSFAAASHFNTLNGRNDVVLSEAAFTVKATNVELDAAAFRMYNKADASMVSSTYALQQLDGTPITTATVTGDFRVVFTGLETSTVNTAIDAGSSQTFVLRAQVNTVGIGAADLRVSLEPARVTWIDMEATGPAGTYAGIESPETIVHSTQYEN